MEKFLANPLVSPILIRSKTTPYQPMPITRYWYHSNPIYITLKTEIMLWDNINTLDLDVYQYVETKSLIHAGGTTVSVHISIADKVVLYDISCMMCESMDGWQRGWMDRWQHIKLVLERIHRSCKLHSVTARIMWITIRVGGCNDLGVALCGKDQVMLCNQI